MTETVKPVIAIIGDRGELGSGFAEVDTVRRKLFTGGFSARDAASVVETCLTGASTENVLLFGRPSGAESSISAATRGSSNRAYRLRISTVARTRASGARRRLGAGNGTSSSPNSAAKLESTNPARQPL